MTEQQYKSNRQTAAMITAGVFAMLFFLMWYILVFIPMNPPLGTGSGVHLNLGFAEEGSGDIQPDYIGNDGKSDEATVKNEASSPPPEESEQAPVQNEKPDVKDDASDLTSRSQEESPVSAPPEKKEEVKKTPEKTPTDKPKEKPAESKPQINPSAVYDPDAKKPATTATTGEGKAGQGGNEGDDKNKTGDKGDPRGVKEGTVYTGNPGEGGPGAGGKGGFGLNLAGWAWDQKPAAPKIEDNENGFVVFKIVVDDQGDIIEVTPIEQTLSAEAVRRCRDKIRERSFVRTAAGALPPRSTGTVRFELVVK